jgi:hypothetical protein
MALEAAAAKEPAAAPDLGGPLGSPEEAEPAEATEATEAAETAETAEAQRQEQPQTEAAHTLDDEASKVEERSADILILPEANGGSLSASQAATPLLFDCFAVVQMCVGEARACLVESSSLDQHAEHDMHEIQNRVASFVAASREALVNRLKALLQVCLYARTYVICHIFASTCVVSVQLKCMHFLTIGACVMAR